MLAGWSGEGHWDRLNDLLAQKFQVEEKSQIKAFLGVGHALAEVCQELAKFYPHRTHLAYVQGTGPFLNPLGVDFAKRGFAVSTFSLSDAQSFADWLKENSSQCLMVLLERDHCFTAQVYAFEPFLQTLHDSKVFAVVVSHHHHAHHAGRPLGAYDVEIRAVDTSHAIGVFGVRARCQSLSTQFIDWRSYQPADFQYQSTPQNRALIEQFEASTVHGALPFLPQGVARIYDRAIIYWADVDGWSVLEELARIRQWPATANRGVACLSSCQWNFHQTDWLSLQGQSPAALRGTILLKNSVIDEKMADDLAAAVAQVRLVQNG